MLVQKILLQLVTPISFISANLKFHVVTRGSLLGSSFTQTTGAYGHDLQQRKNNIK